MPSTLRHPATLTHLLVLAAITAGLAGAPGVAQAAGVQSPCDDPTYARDFKVRYPNEINKIWAEEQKQRDAWNLRADAISRQVVASGAASAQAQSSFRLDLAKRPDIAAFDAQIAQAANDFRTRNLALQGVALISPLDPMRPDRAWCVMANSALDALKAKLTLEFQQEQLVDQALLAAATNRGVRFDP
jgi:hypothetical protein